MNFLRKILLIAIICVFAENTEGMQHQALPLAAPAVGANILDFDTIANVGGNIPAIFQPKIYEPAGYNTAGPNNLRYVYFTVFNPGGAIVPGNVAFQQAVVPAIADPNLNGGFNIFFPMDGHQPTTQEAVSWSCANIDNRENSPITEWYMQMFGVIPFQNAGALGVDDYIKAGWSPPVGGAINAQRIIQSNFAAFFQNTLLQNLIQLGNAISMHNAGAAPANVIPMPQLGGNNLHTLTIVQLNMQTQANIQALIAALQTNIPLARRMQADPTLQLKYNNAIDNLYFLNSMLQANPLTTIDNLQDVVLPNHFANSFRAIASSPVGRVLLYRLLIEIRRYQNVGANNGTVANDANGLNTDGSRDFNRCITICCGGFAFQPGRFFPALGHLAFTVDPRIYFNNIRCNLCTIGGNFGGEDIIRLESVDFNIALFHEMIHWYHRLRAPDRVNFFIAADANRNTRRNNFLWLTYWGPLQIEEKKLFSESQWRSSNNQFFDQEEVFTILGMPNSANKYNLPSYVQTSVISM